MIRIHGNEYSQADLLDCAMDGFCINCQQMYEEQVEPDARGYLCEDCGEPKVYSVAEIALMLLDDDAKLVGVEWT